MIQQERIDRNELRYIYQWNNVVCGWNFFKKTSRWNLTDRRNSWHAGSEQVVIGGPRRAHWAIGQVHILAQLIIY